MATPVITVASGGLAVVDVTATTPKLGLPVTETTRGVAVTKVTAPKAGLAVTYGTFVEWPPPASGGAFTTFDATPVNTTVTNAGLTATHNNTTTNSGTRSTAAKSDGKYYFEMTLQVTVTGLNAVGMILSSVVTYSGTNVTASSTSAYLGSSTAIHSNAADQGKNLGTAVVGDVFGFAVDLTAKLAWIRRSGGNWNADAAANPATGVGGVPVAAGSFVPWVRYNLSGAAGDAVTANFGQTAFVGTVPSGFTSGWPV